MAVVAAGFAISSAKAARRTAQHTQQLADVAAEQLRLLHSHPVLSLDFDVTEAPEGKWLVAKIGLSNRGERDAENVAVTLLVQPGVTIQVASNERGDEAHPARTLLSTKERWPLGEEEGAMADWQYATIHANARRLVHVVTYFRITTPGPGEYRFGAKVVHAESRPPVTLTSAICTKTQADEVAD